MLRRYIRNSPYKPEDHLFAGIYFKRGLLPPEGVTQKSTVRKWYAYLMAVAERMKLTEGPTKVSKLQMTINADPLQH